MGELVDFGSLAEGMSPLEGMLSASEGSGEAELGYAHYISLPKVQSGAMLRVLDNLSKLATSLSAKNVQISADTSYIYIRYENSAYHFTYKVANATGCTLPAYCVAIGYLKKLLSSVVAELVLVSEVVEGVEGLYGYFSGNLIYIETVKATDMQYSYEEVSCTEVMPARRYREELGSFVSLLGYSERPVERQLITQGGFSYINIGSTLGRCAAFFGGHDCVLTRVVVDSIVALSEATVGDIEGYFDADSMALTFDGLHYLRVSYTAGSMVDRFITPMFKDAFTYGTSVGVLDGSFKQLLGVVGGLDYYTDTVRVDFGKSGVGVTVYRKDGGSDAYSFAYSDSEGSLTVGSVVVPIGVLLGVIDKGDSRARYSCTRSTLVVDTGVFVYCVRSILLVE